LITKRLAAPGWHQYDCITPGYQVLNNRKLLTAEVVETEYPAQYVDRRAFLIAMTSLL